MSRGRANRASPVAGDEDSDPLARTFRGRSVEELVQRIRHELGDDAIVVRRREGLAGGIAGFFQRPFVEIDAVAGTPRIDVYDESPTEVRPGWAQPPAGGPPQPARTPFYEHEPSGAPQWQSSSYVSEQLAELARAAPPTPPPALVARPPTQSERPPFDTVLERAASAHSRGPRPTLETRPAGGAGGYGASASRAPSRGGAGTSIRARLAGVGVGERFADEVIEAAAAHILPLSPGAGLTQAVRVGLAQRIPVAPPLPARGAAIAVVGPGGAGKTSCCAALLSAYRRGGQLPASCASVVRGQRRGELALLLSPQILRPLPLESRRVATALRRARDRGLLVIDTPPLSLGDRSGIRGLARLLAALDPDHVVVALPATLGAVAATQLLDALRPLRANALALTHADDTDQIGTAIEAACRFELAPEYTIKRARAGGWRVARLDPTGLAERLLG